jgi:very-short-patch-repair endonuclease
MGRYLGRCSSYDCNRAVWDDGDGDLEYGGDSELLCSRCSYQSFRSRTQGRPESPIEVRFLESWAARYPDVPLYPQFWIGDYRVDFALPEARVVIELDGAATHTSELDVVRDQYRQRFIEAQGWHFIRFTGSDVNRDVRQCVEGAAAQVISYLAALNAAGQDPFRAWPGSS